MSAPVGRITDHDLLDAAQRLADQYAGAIAPARVCQAVLDSGRALRRSVRTGTVPLHLVEQAARRRLVDEIARTTHRGGSEAGGGP